MKPSFNRDRGAILVFCFLMCLMLPDLLYRGVGATLTGEYLWIHDPSRATFCDGKYYLYYTGEKLPMRWSSDLIHWKNGPPVLDKVPEWMHQKVPLAKGELVWAPDVIRVKDQYWLFYSYSTFGSRVSAIGLLSNPTLDPGSPRYSWTERGPVVATDGRQHANAIDPAPVLGPDGDLWLAYGSWDQSGIQLVQLDKQTGQPLGPAASIAAGQATGPEAPYLHYHGGYYYLFENEGFCCRGMNSTYRVMMGRSKTVTGPYLDKAGRDLAHGGGSVFLDSAGEMIGPGHIGILSGQGPGTATHPDSVTYHYYSGRSNGVPALGRQDLLWVDGWPQAAPALAGGRYALINKASGLALGVHDRSMEDGAPLDQFAYNADSMQQWNFVPLGDGYFAVASLGSGKYLDLFECNSADGAKINQQPWYNNDCQRWRIEATAPGYFRLVSKGGGNVLSLPRGDQSPRALMECNAWTGANGQQWMVKYLPANGA